LNEWRDALTITPTVVFGSGKTFVIVNFAVTHQHGALAHKWLHAILSSVLVTCRQHSIPILDYLVELQRFGGNPPPLVSAIPLQLDRPSLPSFQR
jgi:hypothetical protein